MRNLIGIADSWRRIYGLMNERSRLHITKEQHHASQEINFVIELLGRISISGILPNTKVFFSFEINYKYKEVEVFTHEI